MLKFRIIPKMWKSRISYHCLLFHPLNQSGKAMIHTRDSWAIMRPHTYPFSRTPFTKGFLVTNTMLLPNIPLWLSHVQWYLEVLLLGPWTAGYKETARGKLVRSRETSQEEPTMLWWESACKGRWRQESNGGGGTSGSNKSQINEEDETYRMRGVFHRRVFSAFFGTGW